MTVIDVTSGLTGPLVVSAVPALARALVVVAALATGLLAALRRRAARRGP